MFLQLDRFQKDQSGGVMLAFVLALPLVLSGIAAAVEYASLVARTDKLQLAADTAALSATKELGLANADDARIVSVARAVAESVLSAGSPKGTSATVTAQVFARNSGVRVAITETVGTTMGRLLSLPTATLNVNAAAQISGSRRLCVLILDPSAPKALGLDMNARLTAEGCAVQSNSTDRKGIEAKDLAVLVSERTTSSGGFDGKSGTNFMPTPITGAPAISDPLANRAAPPAGGCDHQGKILKSGATTLQPGVYCGGLTISGEPGSAATVTLASGVYVLKDGPLVVEKGATLQGEHAGFYFQGDKSTLAFAVDSTISLSAPKTGALAGLLFFEDRAAPLGRRFNILSDGARKLLGTIYLPRGSLYVDAKKPVADQSAYTVIVARQMQLSAGPNLVLNSNYGGTDVPVPDGVGPTAGRISLTN